MSARKTVFDMVSRFESNGEIKSYNMRMTGPPPILIEAVLTEKQHLLQQRAMNKKKNPPTSNTADANNRDNIHDVGWYGGRELVPFSIDFVKRLRVAWDKKKTILSLFSQH